MWNQNQEDGDDVETGKKKEKVKEHTVCCCCTVVPETHELSDTGRGGISDSHGKNYGLTTIVRFSSRGVVSCILRGCQQRDGKEDCSVETHTVHASLVLDAES